MTKVRKAVITAAGRGTRLFPATKTVQKELLPLVDTDGFCKPTLQIIAEEAVESGFEEICIIANSTNLPAIRQHFEELSEVEISRLKSKAGLLEQANKLAKLSRCVTYVTQEEQEGYGHAVYQAKDWVGDEPFLLLLGDHVYLSTQIRCARQVAQAYERFHAPVSSVAVLNEDYLYRYGTVQGEEIGTGAYKIVGMAEKPGVEFARRHLRTPGLPAGFYLCFFGMHVFEPSIFDCLKYIIDSDIRQNGEYQLTSAQEILLKRSQLYVASTVDGQTFDMGIPEGFIETQIALALASPFKDRVLKSGV